LLVALPQAPEARRRDRHLNAARRSRDFVLKTVVAAGVLSPAEAEEGKREVLTAGGKTRDVSHDIPHNLLTLGKSWLGTGQNAPVAPKDLGAALGRENVRQAADQAGIPPDDLLTQLSKALPGLIDRLSPNGRLPNTQEISDMLRKR
jgi:YidB-like protein